MWKNWFVILLLLIGFGGFLQAQELRCNISITSQSIQTTNRELFNNMQRDMYEFLNNTRWSENVFTHDERIECSMHISLDEQIGSGQFRGSVQVRVARPVYGSSYNSSVLNFKDNDIDFTYREFEPLEYNESGQNTNLVNILAFYANIILGLDYDSFSLMGGNEFYNRAENIVVNSQNAREKGWKSFESRRNRYWLINNLQDRSYALIRECIYRYHRLGLDVMSDNVTDGRLVIIESLELMRKANRSKPNSYIVQVFFDAKADEIVNIFKPAFTDERKRLYNIVTEINPANNSKYGALIKEKTN